jgi:anaerobic dimethyl sulfoxide reductase subunit B (iron-sulfur subunit)
MGCRYCEWVCPYGAPQFDPELKMMTKCNLCEDYILAGQKPSCVDSCPMRALDFGTFNEMSEKYGTLARVFPLPDPALTGPGMILKPHKDAGKASAESAVVNVREDL